MRPTFALALVLASLSSTADAFWGPGHLLVARGAESILADEAPDALHAALEQLKALKESHPETTPSEGDHPFTECATYADEIKDTGGMWQFGWHFKDQPYLDEGGSLDDYDFQIPTENVTHALTALTAFLRDDELTQDDMVYINILASHYPEVADQLSVALRFVIHYIGDIQQPLHTVTKVDHEYPEGDMGGNLDKVHPAREGVDNLHSIWDSVIYEFPGYPTLPMDQTEWDQYTSDAQTIADDFPFDDSMIMPLDYDSWAAEGLTDAQNDVYQDFIIGLEPSPAYKERARTLIKTKIHLGSRRLAEQIKYIYGDQQPSFFLQ